MTSLRTVLFVGAIIFMVDSGAAAGTDEAMNVLHEGIQARDKDEVAKFKGRATLLDSKNSYGYTALQEAIRYGYFDMVQLLVELGADPNALDVDGRNAMHHAAQSDEPAAARLLINKGVAIEKQDPYQYTPLHLAAREGNERLVKVLLDAGADINATIDVGFTAVDLADRYPSLQDYLRTRGGMEGHKLR